MVRQAELQARFQQEDISRRMGAIAANLRRISGCSEAGRDQVAALSMIEESRLFIDWSLADAELQAGAFLRDVQRSLAQWSADWDATWQSTDARGQMASSLGAWSDRVLELSGLLTHGR